MTFSPDQLLERLQALTAGDPCSRWIVAYSGGIDSTVLLHALCTSGNELPVVAAHVDHGLHPQSADWAERCRRYAGSLGIEFRAFCVAVADAGGGIEAAARDARYRVLRSIVAAGDCLLSGHHEDDQAETLLLNLMRGSGPAGLAGIGAAQPFGAGRLLRPMLGTGSAEIAAYAAEAGLDWIDDPANDETRFDRNYLRREILPRLRSRWPAAARQLRRSAALAGEASALLDDLADQDIAACGRGHRLSITALRCLPAPRQRNLLRRAVRQAGLPPIPAARIEQALHSLVTAREDAGPLVCWDGGEMRRYRDELFVLAPAGQPRAQAVMLFPGCRPQSLGPGLGEIALVDCEGAGIDRSLAAAGLALRFRAGGERIRIAGGGATKTLKNLLQESGVLPWMRMRLPMLFAGDQLVAVGDQWLSADHLSTPGIAVEWHHRPEIR